MTSRFRRTISLALAAACLATLTSCAPVMQRWSNEPNWKGWRPQHASGTWLRKGGLRARMVLASAERRVIIENGPVMMGKVVAFDITNDVGSVTIQTSKRYSETRIQANIRFEGRHRLASKQEGWDYDHKGPWFHAVLEATAETGIVHINPTDHTLEDGTRPFVDLVITTPMCDGLIVQNRWGDVLATGVGGEVVIESEGHITLKTDQPVFEKISLQSSKGDVVVIANPESRGTFLITAPKGRAAFNSPYGRTDHSRPRPGEWSGVFNNGTNSITLHSDKGHATWFVHDNPEMYTYRNADLVKMGM